ncbi:MAG TPA: DNA repair protein RecO [Blastocatellia bacterium]|nr:DNA repair protein RecO [Blastocatellia bacterium]
MSLITTEAFVLRTYSLAEADKICVFFTRQTGKVRGVAHGAKKIRSRFGSSLEPLTEVRLKYHQKENRDLIHVSTCDIVRSHFNRAARDVETASAFSYLAELLSELAPEHESNEKLYRLVGASLEAIEQGHDLAQILRYFEAWVLRLSGFYPEPSICVACSELIPEDETAFIGSEGSPRCRTCSMGRGIRTDGDVRRILFEIFRTHPTAFAASRIAPSLVASIGEINYQIIRHVLERDLRSRSHLESV